MHFQRRNLSNPLAIRFTDGGVFRCTSFVAKLLIRVINFLGINGPARNLA